MFVGGTIFVGSDVELSTVWSGDMLAHLWKTNVPKATVLLVSSSRMGCRNVLLTYLLFTAAYLLHHYRRTHVDMHASAGGKTPVA